MSYLTLINISRQLTINCLLGNLFRCSEVASPPVFASKFRPYPNFALTFLQQVEDIFRAGIKVVQVDRDDFLPTEFDIHRPSGCWGRRRTRVVHALLGVVPNFLPGE